MKFKKVMRGYDSDEVDKYIVKLTATYEDRLGEQKDRIFNLVEENYRLSEKLKGYESDEKAISKSLIESQKLAEQLKDNADSFARITLNRAKIFHATWSVCAKSMINEMSAEQVSRFNETSRKIEKLIKEYEGKSTQTENASDIAPINNSNVIHTDDITQETAVTTSYNYKFASSIERENIKTPLSQSNTKANSAPTPSTQDRVVGGLYTSAPIEQPTMLINPIEKVASVSREHVVELSELAKSDETLEELCRDLGLID